jgi:hypothetical protein
VLLHDRAEILNLLFPKEAEQTRKGEPGVLLKAIGVSMKAGFFEIGLESVFHLGHQLLGWARAIAFFRSEISTRV